MSGSKPIERRVLHVLPHPGGGGETYVDSLAEMDGHSVDRVYLAASANHAGALTAISRNAIRVHRQARAYDLLHVHGEIPSILCLAALATRPSVVTLHGLNVLRRVTGVGRAAAKANLRLILGAASKTICVSNSEHDDVVEAVGVAAARRAVAIRNGVHASPPPTAEDRAAVRSELGIASSTSIVLFVGPLVAVKDPLTAVRAAIEAARRGQRLRLVVVGDGMLRTQIEREGGETVTVLGFRRDVGRLLAAADLLVLPSLREALGYVVLEAMAAGVVPVVSSAPGTAEAVGDAGVVAPIGDVSAFADAFVRLLQDDGERQRLGSMGPRRVATEFSLNEMVSRTREVYDEVVPD